MKISYKIIYLFILSLLIGIIFYSYYNSKNENLNLPISKKEAQEFHIEITNHKFYPDVIEAKANTKIKLIVKNNDNEVEEFESDDLMREKIIAPNQSIKIVLAPLKPGVYKFFGEFHPDSAIGSLHIKE